MEEVIRTKTEYSIFSIQKRLLSFIMIVAFLFFLILIRLFYLQTINNKNMQVRAVEQWVRSLPLTAKRGQIQDINGNILAISYTSYDVFVRAKEVKNYAETASYLSSVLNLDYSKVYEKVRNVFISESLLKLQIDENLAKRIVEKNLDGVYLSENIKRYYPYGKSLSQILGFLTSDSHGQSGGEQYFDHILSGKNGKYLTQSDVRGVVLDNSLNYYIEPCDGMNIRLNIDINIQHMAENALEQLMLEHKPKKASIIVLNPMTSQIIATAITPSFDLNNIPRDNVKELMEKSKNITVTDVYEPGSTFKILTLAAALSENLTNINERFYCPGYRIIDGQKIKCWRTIGHGSQSLAEAVQNSCNCCFMDLAMRLGKEKLYKYLKLFGIGSQSGVDMSGESPGILLNMNSVQNVDLARIAFGQTVAVNQLQLINAFCSAINGGVLHTPQLANSYLDGERVCFDNKTLIKNRTINGKVVKDLRYLLEKSLSKNGDLTFIPGFQISGKTGTSQKYSKEGSIDRGKYVSSFFGFINQGDNPSYAILLCVDEPSNGAYYGSIVAKPYAKILLENIIKYKNIKPADPNLTHDSKLQVPNLVGKSLAEAVSILEKNEILFEIDGEGRYVKSQFPSANYVISKSQTILIRT